MHRLRFIAVLGFLLIPASLPAADTELASNLADQRELAVTIYNDNLALVKDTRRIKLERGTNRLAWRDVSARIRPETALLRNPGHPEGFYLIEQNFDFDLLTPQKLLDKYVDQEVRVIKTNPATGVETTETAKVLATNSGVVLQFPDRIETGLPGRLAFKSVPANLHDRPTLAILFHSPASEVQNLELTYLTGGLAWKADYTAELSVRDDQLDLNGWVTLTNTSGAAYQNARLQLVAGDVNRVREELAPATRGMVMSAPAPAAPKIAEESLFEYHLYTLDRLTTIADQQTKQVALLTASTIPLTKEFVLRGADYYYRSSYGDLGQKLKVGVFVEFDNKGANLGLPLPKGIVRVYKKDAAGNAQFVGEDRIDHTPKGEKVRLKLGDAFDVTADKKQTDFQKLSGSGRFNYVMESAYQIELKNAKNEDVTVKVLEPLPGDWEILSENHPHNKETANTASWRVSVPANGKALLTYRARVKY
jgi:hypothetical protein